MSGTLLAGVELGGTKCVCILGTGPDDIRARVTLPTLDPDTTRDSIAAVIQKWREQPGPPLALGVASFGPIDLRRESPTYGCMGATPKRGWANADIAGYFTRRFALPVGITTDVIGAALAEGRWGDAQGLSDYAYITVGTGIGAGIIVAGQSVFGCHHPEVGHARIVRARGDTWPGNCPFHGDCIEGLASGPAIEARSGKPAGSLESDSPVWETVVHALAQLIHLLVVTAAPQRILIGGGVMSAQPHLFPRIRRAVLESLNGYLHIPQVLNDIDRFIAPPGLGTLAGPLGALAIAATIEL
ncbi:MAG TPA: ROK family protein [Steroidobacteraceae bacterium]|jgi:fructokinase|nr:ROK family protein [Steroidobacteraceae bacterium]